MKRSSLLLPLGALLSGCAGGQGVAAPATVPGWRALVTPDDRKRLGDWRSAWVEALRQSRASGHVAAVAREGALLQPDAALGGAALGEGSYACRVIKLGANGPGGLAYVAYPAFACRIDRENGLQHFNKLTGSQRPVGHLYPETDSRTVFLGTLVLGDERMAIKYGRDRERDMAGVVERVGPRQWRLVLPFPRFESIVDVIELVPTST
jgi:hypothetical protein